MPNPSTKKECKHSWMQDAPIKVCYHCGFKPTPLDKVTTKISDTKPFEHGEEGTHGCCQEISEKMGDKATCCSCTGHKCKDNWDEDKEREDALWIEPEVTTEKEEQILDAAKFSNFCQKLKMLLWEEGFSGEDKMDKVALEMWGWLKPSQLSYQEGYSKALSKARTEVIEEVEKEFIREFCNDHNGKPRWLRGIAVDMEDLLEQIIAFLSTLNPDAKRRKE